MTEQIEIIKAHLAWVVTFLAQDKIAHAHQETMLLLDETEVLRIELWEKIQGRKE